MAGTYGNVHRAVVQTFMSKKIMPEKEALELVKSAARCVRRRVRACAALPLAARLLRAVRARSLSRHPRGRFALRADGTRRASFLSFSPTPRMSARAGGTRTAGSRSRATPRS